MTNKRCLKYFSRVVSIVKLGRLYPGINVISGPSASPEAIINGKKYLTFCSNNYLGLALDKDIKEETIEGIKRYGVGSGSTRLLSGTLDIQVEFEKKLAKFMDFEEAITFSSGFLANIGVIRMMIDNFPYFKIPGLDKDGVILSDQLNHASIIDAVRLSHAERVVYRHNDMDDLERLLKEKKNLRKLIITDGVFSMDGDLANLKTISDLAEKYDALIFVDDSHGVGVLGHNGEGLAHYLGVEKKIDVIMGSFTKAFGSIGGFIVCNKSLSEYLRITARSYIFSDPIIPAVTKGLIKALEKIKTGSILREKTLGHAKYLRENLKRMGFEVLGDIMPIIPPLLHSEKNAIKFSKKLFEKGILAPPVRRPAVPEGKERLRLTTMATHTREQIDYLLENMEKIGKELKII